MNRLRDLREDADLSIAETARIFGLHPTQYRRYEIGESDMPLHWAITFAKHYNVSIDYIAGLTNEPRQSKIKDYVAFADTIKNAVNEFFKDTAKK